MEERYYLYTFESTHGAIAAHQLLRDTMPAVVMPVLREINASCGIAVKVPEEHFEKSREMMEQEMPGDYSLYHVAGKEITCLVKEEK